MLGVHGPAGVEAVCGEKRTVIQALKSVCQVVVVDPCHTDYAHLLDSAVAGDVSLRLLSTGRAALRAARELNPDLWIINTQLPDTHASSGHGTPSSHSAFSVHGSQASVVSLQI